jgi:hypothetical protein
MVTTRDRGTSNPGLVGDLIIRFVMKDNAEGLHNSLMVRMGPWVILNTTTDEEAYDAYESWWNHYHRLGACGPVEPSRIYSRVNYLHRCLESGKIKRKEGNFPHREELERVTLSPAQVAACQSKTFKIDKGLRERGESGRTRATWRRSPGLSSSLPSSRGSPTVPAF